MIIDRKNNHKALNRDNPNPFDFFSSPLSKYPFAEVNIFYYLKNEGLRPEIIVAPTRHSRVGAGISGT
ncbi:MAG TPA: hypothetical protein PK037_15270, partial [Saprospiraceae bacterium]|nr:hypothetical protein [Saprospiraceae bacterium]